MVRYEGYEGSCPEPPVGEIDENTLVVVVEYVDTPIPRIDQRRSELAEFTFG